jgi:hypothetical protein
MKRIEFCSIVNTPMSKKKTTANYLTFYWWNNHIS